MSLEKVSALSGLKRIHYYRCGQVGPLFIAVQSQVRAALYIHSAYNGNIGYAISRAVAHATVTLAVNCIVQKEIYKIYYTFLSELHLGLVNIL